METQELKEIIYASIDAQMEKLEKINQEIADFCFGYQPKKVREFINWDEMKFTEHG